MELQLFDFQLVVFGVGRCLPRAITDVEADPF
jgi:hypothetical protein